MKILVLICRILLGLIFVVFGANGLHQFIPAPMPPTGNPLGDFVALMQSTGWTTAVATFQVIGGLLVLIGGTLPLGLCILCPITVNILLFHTLLHATAPAVFAPAILVTILEIVLLYAYRGSFAGIFTTQAKPTN
ncbi:MAG TPA: DoxX family protein [Acidobacteriaceae bacterium]